MKRKYLDLHPDGTLDFLQGIVDTMREVLVVLDANLQVQAVNKAFYDTFIVAPRKTLGVPLFALGNGQWDIPRLREQLGQIVQHGGAFKDFEVTHDFPGVGRKTLLLNARRLVLSTAGQAEHNTSTAGKADYVLLVMQDVTDQKQVELALRQVQQDLKERVRRRTAELETVNKELETFAYAVAHDLRAPLRTLAGFSQALMEDHAPALNDEGHDYARRIQGAASEMAQVIDSLLDLAGISRRAMTYEPVDLSAFARTIVDELAQAMPEREVRVRIQDGPVAEGDAVLLKRVLQNLLENAWKYTRPTLEAQIRFGATESNGHTVYYVRDNGVGFDMTYADKLFTPFQRMDTALSFEGHGVGLATASRILKRHGGCVWAEEVPGQGATFFFRLANDGATPPVPIHRKKRPCLKP